jgi:hypothetical protein
MKTTVNAILISLVPVLLLPALVSGASAQAAPAVPMNTIYAGADGKFEAPPDTAVLRMDVSSQQNTSREAYDKIAAAAERVRQALRNNGLDPKVAQVGFYAVQPVINWKDPKRKVVGYRVDTTITLKLRDFSKIGPITDQLADIEEAQSQSLSYTLEDIEQAKSKAAEDALRKARNQANAVATAGGRTLGELLQASVDVSQVSIIPVQSPQMMARAGVAAAPAPTAERQRIVRAKVARAEIVRPCLLRQHQRQSVLGVADDDDLGVGALGQGLRGLNAFPLQELRADSLGHDLLEVMDALGFNPLAVRFLALFLQAEAHGQ